MPRSDAQPSQIDPLTALRFFAAAWVVMYHYWPALDVAVTPNLVAKGYLGVELFFVLSGFVISHVYQAAVEAGRFRYGAFLWARLARVYPLHLATLGAVAALGVAALAAGVAIGGEVLHLPSLPANLLLVHAWGFAPEASFNHPSWSISAEWFAYLLFPAFAAVALRFRRRPALAVWCALLLVFASYIGFEALTGRSLTQATIHWGALRIVPCFALGCAVHLLWRSGAFTRRWEAWSGVAASTLAILVLADLAAPDALLTACFGSLIFSVAGLWSTGALRAAPGFVLLGEISYSTYMICIPWKLLAVNGAVRAFGLPEERLPLSIWLAVVLALIPLSALSYYLVERPARGWLKAHAPRSAGREATLVSAG